MGKKEKKKVREYLEGGYFMWGTHRLVIAEFYLYILSILFACCCCLDFVVYSLFCIIALISLPGKPYVHMHIQHATISLNVCLIYIICSIVHLV